MKTLKSHALLLSRPSSDLLDVEAVLHTARSLLNSRGLLTRLAALRWIELLGRLRPADLLLQMMELLPLMLNLLTDPAEEVMRLSRAIACVPH